MKPYFSLPIFGEFHTNTFFMGLSFVFSLFFLFRSNKASIPFWQILVMTSVTAWMSFVGARLFHVLFERGDYFYKNPGQIFSQFDGMTFYGALILGSLSFFILTKLFRLTRPQERKLWDDGTLMLTLTLFLMRLGCFANGCCWGKISASIFSVRYFDTRSVMPYLGIPVHPVQIYDAFWALCLLVFFIILRKEKKGTGLHMAGFCVLYPIGRFVTEFYRGDHYRGENIIAFLSVGQILSLIIFLVGCSFLFIRRKPIPSERH